jgi:hypothetical protein
VQASFPGEEEVSSHGSSAMAAQGGAELMRRAQLVQVLQGQVATWSLVLTNTSLQPISSCYVQVGRLGPWWARLPTGSCPVACQPAALLAVQWRSTRCQPAPLLSCPRLGASGPL